MKTVWLEAAEAWVKNPCEETRKAAAAAYAAAAARLTERKWQAGAIRKIVSNPFANANGYLGLGYA